MISLNRWPPLTTNTKTNTPSKEDKKSLQTEPGNLLRKRNFQIEFRINL